MSETRKLPLQPFGDRILCRKLEAIDKTPGGVLLPDTGKQKSQRCTVVAIGPGKFSERLNRIVPVGESVQVGKTYLYRGYGYPVPDDLAKDFVLITEDAIDAIVDR